MIKVRFAPSPTGFLHIGSARTALFNWMYAKAQEGEFVLRIEDTDQERSKEEYLEEILASVKWLGLDWDELYKQSERFSIYEDHAKKLLDEGKAYKQGDAVLLKMNKEQIKIYDIIRGEIDFDTANFFVKNEDGSPVLDDNGEPKLKDEVLMKADGSPAFSFCNVIDDALMGITHVIRGEDHISNTPKQILIYNALGFKIPKFAHMPLIMGEDGSRLSKRTGAVAVSEYKNLGFLPEGLVNYLMLLGWSPGNNQEVITLDSAVKKFSIKKINKAAAIFSIDKLKWINGQHIKQTADEKLVNLLTPFLKEKGVINQDSDSQKLKSVVNLYKSRLSTLLDFLEWTDFVFVEKPNISQELKEKYLFKDRKEAFNQLADRLDGLNEFNLKTTEDEFRGLVEELNIKSADLVHPVRVALTGKTVGPGLFDIMVLLDKRTTVNRLKEAALNS